MELTLDSDHPLAQAINSASSSGLDLWLVLKPAGLQVKSTFRAKVTQWSRHRDGTTNVKFETWEDHSERLAQLSGL